MTDKLNEKYEYYATDIRKRKQVLSPLILWTKQMNPKWELGKELEEKNKVQMKDKRNEGMGNKGKQSIKQMESVDHAKMSVMLTSGKGENLVGRTWGNVRALREAECN